MSVRPIGETLARLGGGLFLDEASEELNKLVQIVESTGKGRPLPSRSASRRPRAAAQCWCLVT